jgi:hypothetical protein
MNKHTLLLWLYKSPCRSQHVVTASASPSGVFQQSECIDVFFIGALSVPCQTVSDILFLLTRMSLRWGDQILKTKKWDTFTSDV